MSNTEPLDILVVNLLAAFLLGLVAALHRRQVLSDDVNMLLGAGIMGGMSTFSSFVYGSVLMHASIVSAGVASVYVVVSGVRLPRDRFRTSSSDQFEGR